jgi:hypothetical protein
MALTYKGAERRRLPRLQLTGAALLASCRGTQPAMTAVLDNVNRLGAGFHAKEMLKPNEAVAVTLVFLNEAGEEEKERVLGKVAWAQTYERGSLIGVRWDQPVTKATHACLGTYLEQRRQG